jgi:hypothetical protein
VVDDWRGLVVSARDPPHELQYSLPLNHVRRYGQEGDVFRAVVGPEMNAPLAGEYRFALEPGAWIMGRVRGVSVMLSS